MYKRHKTLEDRIELGAKFLKLLQGGDTRSQLCKRFDVVPATVTSYVKLVTKNFHFDRKGGIVFY
jgi:hypothetical protein